MNHSAIEPAIRNSWLETHDRHAGALANAKPEVVFSGDSLTDLWGHQPSWERDLGKYKPINLGIGGDRTQHLLWRLKRQKLPQAKLYSLLIGTNNIGCNTTEEIIEGMRACRDEIHRQAPETIILIHHLLPREKHRSNPCYQQVIDVNRLIPSLIDGNRFVEADFTHVFQVAGEMHLNYEHILEDNVHFTSRGYDAWAKALVPVIDKLLGCS